jgi:hypothetical protein
VPATARARIADRRELICPSSLVRVARPSSCVQAGGSPLDGVYGAKGVVKIERPAPPPPPAAVTSTSGPSPALDKKKKRVRSSFCEIQ